MVNNEFLINKHPNSIPPKDSVEYNAFWDEERKKAEYGITVHGVFFPGWLYWHTQLWHILQNVEDPINKVIKRLSLKASLRDNEWIIAEAIEEAQRERKGAMIFGSRRLGKELADYEPLITPSGEVPIGDIKVGDIVYGRDGKKTNITHVFPQGVKPIYRLHFLDGRYIDAGLEHQWCFERWQGRGKNRKKVEVIKTTKDLLNLKLKSACKSGYTYIYYLPQPKPVEFDEKEFVIPPYIMGLLLGDGCLTSGTPYISTDDDEIESYIKYYIGDKYNITYDINEINRLGRPLKRYITTKDRSIGNPIRREIDRLGLNKDSYNKFIHDNYKYSSVEQRFELLRGLLDSDGSITKSGSIEFSVNNETLAKDVLWLVRSLGIRAEISHEPKKTITKKMPGNIVRTFYTEKWRVHIRTSLPVFKLKRKLDRIKPRKNTSSVALDRIEFIGNFPATCITVDNEDHLYLAKDFIVTHNSEAIASYLAHGATLFEGTENVVTAGNWGDIDVIMSKVVHGLNNLPDYFKFGRLSENLRKEIELGFKDKKGTRLSWSKIICRNHEDGNKTEAIAGLTPSRFVMDEVGKALKHGSIVYLEDGVKKIEDVQVGDKIYNHEGVLVNVIKINPQPVRDLYEITLKDGRTVTCSPEHLWYVWDAYGKGSFKTMTTEDMYNNQYISGNSKRMRWFIPSNKPVKYSTKDLPIDPYYLGLWLSDGSKSTTAITTMDKEIEEYIREYANKLGLKMRITRKSNNKAYLCSISTGEYSGGKARNVLLNEFKKLNLINNKHIPEIYKYSDVNQRLELLRGLLDGDGSCSIKNATIEFSQTDNKVADDFEQLVRSLGINCYRSIKKTKNLDSNRFRLFTSLPVFKLSRKRNIFESKTHNPKSLSYISKVGISKIVKVKEGLSTCITVDTEDGLFLTDNFVVTHNSKFIEVFEAAKPAFSSEFGWRCTPLLSGTSGDIKSGTDAENFFNNPESQNFIVRELIEEGGKKCSVFISGKYRMDAKETTTFGNFIENEKGIYLPKDSELFLIPMQVKNEEKAIAIINEERKQAEKNPDPSILLKQKMYFPLNTKELFLADDGNNFPREALNEHLEFLKANPHLQGRACELFRNNEGKVQINWNTNKKPIIEFPIEKSKFAEYKKDAPVVIYEPPTDLDSYFLYISGLDSYNMSSSAWSHSLGCLFIFKRTYDPISGTFQRRIVAEYTARPESMKVFHDTCIMLLELYNATCMIENEAQTTIQYFDLNNKSHLLAEGYSLLKEIHPTTSITNRNKGLPATKPVQRHYKELIYQYLTEEIVLDFDKDGNPIKKLGLVRIPSIGLLLELINYNDEGNFDRYVAFGHVLTYEAWADKMYPVETGPPKEKEKKDEAPKIRSPFRVGKSPFSSLNRKNPFGI